MEFLEKDLEQIVFEADRKLLKKRGLDIAGKLFRQVKIGNYGVADLIEFRRPQYFTHIGTHHPFEIVIYELKKENVGISTFLQAIRYAKGVLRYLGERGFDHTVRFKIVCIGKKMDTSSSYIYLCDFLSPDLETTLTLENYTYSYRVDGVKFEKHFGYKMREEGF